MKREKKRRGNSIMRMLFIGVSVVLQLGWFLLIILELNAYSTSISAISSLLASIAVLRLYSKHTTSGYKMPWIMLIMAMPVMGLSLYLLAELIAVPRRMGKRLKPIRRETRSALTGDPEAEAQLREQFPELGGLNHYLANCAGAPVYRNTRVTYYPETLPALEAMKQELDKAEHFIFMEYFIVENGVSFDPILEILERKVKQGVEVRLMYDDIGSIGDIDLRYAKHLNSLGIQCRPFNVAVPMVNLAMNHRDHRKITVVDGKVAFTGGFNLANEYFGVVKPYGHWKDTGIRLEGEAVQSLTATFLELWMAGAGETADFRQYLPAHSVDAGDCLVQPFADDPLTDERVAESALLSMIGTARDRLYFITPYLMITDELNRALGLAAKRGVDVRLITPGVPDKKTVYAITRSYYNGLVREGVRIYEYAPGFCHAKQCVCDDKVAMIGTSNLDYRSLYLHFENDVILYGGEAVADMVRDFEETLPQCREVTEEFRTGRSSFLRIWQCILRLFAPML